MAIHWKLKKYAIDQHSLIRLKDLQQYVVDKTGIIISVQHLSDLVRGCPKSIKLSTMETLCSAFNCTLSDLLVIEPSKRKGKTTKKLSYQSTPLKKRGVKEFPNPSDYK